MTDLTLHGHPFAAYCWKALIACYERDVPFTSVTVDDRAPLAALWPPAGMPVLVDAEAGRVVPESSIVIEYLDRIGTAPPLVPTSPDAALEARLWDRVIDGQVMTPMQTIVGDNLRPSDDRDPFGVAAAHSALAQTYPFLDTRLGEHTWLAGAEFTLADCAAAPALHYADAVHPVDRTGLPHLAAYLERLFARPSVARVIDEARPFRSYFPLPWPAHVA